MKNTYLIFLFTIMIMACQKDPASSESQQASIALKTQYVSSLRTKQAFNKHSQFIEEITITRARFLVRNVKLRSLGEDSVEFLSDPYIIDLNLNGQQNTIEIKDVPVDTYDRIDFSIHRLDDDDPLDLAFFQHPDFQDFVDDNRYSMVIEGTLIEGNSPESSFIFKSRENEKQRHFLNPFLVVDQSTNQISVIFEINGTNWFIADDGSLLDPRDESNENEISENLKESIRIVKDNTPDDNSDDDNIDYY